jgi:hypothetical protein
MIINERRLSLRDSAEPPAPSIWHWIAMRYGAIPMVLTFIFTSISTVGAARGLMYLLFRFA